MTTNDNLLGQQLDEYRVEELLGHGGMARVYRGLDLRLKRYVAIKVIDTPLRADTEYALRFEREAQAIGKLDHPNIVRLYRYGEAYGVLYMAMQYIEGVDLGFVLNDYHTDGEFIEPEESVRIIGQVCAALDYAHSQGVIHRDVKPANIMLDKQGRAILTDFGLVLLTELGTHGEIFGSPHYVAPEQAISSAGAVPQSDLYAVGIMLYEMFTGQWPYNAENPMDIALLHMEGMVTPPRVLRPDLSLELEAVILKAMAREPDQRFATGAELTDALKHALRQTTSAPSATTHQRMSIPERVAVEVEAHPLPPVPAEVTPLTDPSTRPALPPVPVSAPPPAPPTQPQRKTSLPTLALAGIGLGIMLLLAAVVGIYWRFSSGDDNNASNLVTAPVVSDETVIAQQQTVTQIPLLLIVPSITPSRTTMPTYTPFSLPTPTFLPTNTTIFVPIVLPTLSPAPTLTSVPIISSTPVPPITSFPQAEISTGYGLLIARSSTGSLFIVNATIGYDFPLEPLRLGNGPGAVSGNEWGIESLLPNQCVTVRQLRDDSKAPNVICEIVGKRITREIDTGFNMLSLEIYYQDVLVDTCVSERCIVQIPLSHLGNAPLSARQYDLLIARKKDDSLFVVNQSAEPFPLPLLQLGEGDGAINGVEWNVELLALGECTTAWKDSDKPKAPDVTCDQVGNRLTRAGKERFWKKSFPVYFQGELVATCNQDMCAIIISR